MSALRDPLDAGLTLPDRVSPSRTLGTVKLQAGEPSVLANLEGPGCIRRIWIAMSRGTSPEVLRQIILKVWWDDAEEPAVEAPLPDFFGMLHGLLHYPLNSRYLISQSQTGATSVFPMPFSKRARVSLEAGPEAEGQFVTWHLDWHRYRTGALQETFRFHAQFRREFPCKAFGPGYLILDAVGRGRFLGFVYGVRLYDDRSRWSHAGAENIYLANDADAPGGAFSHLRGSGGEDTFGAAYGGVLHSPSTHLDQGIPYYVHEDSGPALARHRLAAYRFFTHDSITFDRAIQVHFGCMANDICSTAYWYQDPPHRPFTSLPPWGALAAGTETTRTDDLKLLGGTPTWWVCGPFHPSVRDTTGALAAEQHVPDPGQRYPENGYPKDSPWNRAGRSGACWEHVRDIHGFVDFSRVFVLPELDDKRSRPAMGLAETELVAPVEGAVDLHVGWVGELRIQINDGLWQSIGSHPLFDTVVIPADLRKGPNRVRITLLCPSPASGTTSFAWGSWVFALRAVLANGQTINNDSPMNGTLDTSK